MRTAAIDSGAVLDLGCGAVDETMSDLEITREEQVEEMTTVVEPAEHGTTTEQKILGSQETLVEQKTTGDQEAMVGQKHRRHSWM